MLVKFMYICMSVYTYTSVDVASIVIIDYVCKLGPVDPPWPWPAATVSELSTWINRHMNSIFRP